jgi:hypothetical protein
LLALPGLSERTLSLLRQAFAQAMREHETGGGQRLDFISPNRWRA